MSKILVFPGGMPRALAYAEQALASGLDIVGASSLPSDPEAAAYPEWARLPLITADEFEAAFLRLCAERRITAVYSPHPVVWEALRRMLGGRTAVRLLNDNPARTEEAPFVLAEERAAAFSPPAWDLSVREQRPRLSSRDLATLLLHVERVPGMCDLTKQFALAEAMRSTPAGDLVEIGSWWGKSALAIRLLAKHFALGSLLCVDPWAADCLRQFDEGNVVDQVAASLDCDRAFRMFCMNLAPYADGRVNYLRMPAAEAVSRYRTIGESVESPEFGRTSVAGNVAFLHVDGNHHYEAVLADVRAWAPLLVPGAWIVIDDYRWPFGDGPQRVADDFIYRHAARLEACFVAGGALFAKFRASP